MVYPPRSHFLDEATEDHDEGDAGVKVVLHEEVLLETEEDGEPQQSHVGADDSGLGVQGGEPLLGEHAQPRGGFVDGSGVNWEVDEIVLVRAELQERVAITAKDCLEDDTREERTAIAYI